MSLVTFNSTLLWLCKENVEVAAVFNTRQNIFDMSNDQSKRIREEKKSLTKAAAAALYHVPYQQSVLFGPSSWLQHLQLGLCLQFRLCSEEPEVGALHGQV